ncbi:gamma-glutamyl-gamma-aminobutyrate hydrolase family protein [Halobacteriovorax sp. GB3]|uniref:gamma-glutamyl-gamma-aminobutyrate hydrolase family protein n=1 Tax=Halobacteriovorax sp. GB3 TaxID=2719615 RepID=UPI00236251E6|nr:gamma-glutamyl-gamma-aminobutyrate hydrolase family protein [Halobacteriovorax sp. GB3]MDD0853715.1 gamma-glutamyl-gamma-aminobutyrate hydrolase family protein [Halobacteriovorax sp. GB3]
MMKFYSLFLIFIFTLSASASELFVWKQFSDGPKIILYREDGQSYNDAVSNYLNALNKSPHLKTLRQQRDLSQYKVDGEIQFEKGQIETLERRNWKPRFIVVINEIRELFNNPIGRRIVNVDNILSDYGAEVYTLPVVHDVHLNGASAKEYRRKIIEQFDATLVLGGADIDPYLYGENNTFSKGLVRKRDLSELKFVRSFIQAKRGMSFGICRGHQMCAVANGKKLTQDIQIEKNADHIHLKGEHLIEIKENSELSRLFDKKEIKVNSLHHQEVDVLENDDFYRISGVSYDNWPIVEALEFRNNLGMTIQFHPELMPDEIGTSIMRRFVELAQKQKNARSNCFELINEYFNN